MKYNVSLYYIIFFVLTCVRGLKCHQIIHLNRQNFFVNLWGWLPYFIYIEAIQCLLTIMEQKVFIFRYLKLLLQLFSSLNYISLPYCLIAYCHGWSEQDNFTGFSMYHVIACIGCSSQTETDRLFSLMFLC